MPYRGTIQLGNIHGEAVIVGVGVIVGVVVLVCVVVLVLVPVWLDDAVVVGVTEGVWLAVSEPVGVAPYDKEAEDVIVELGVCVDVVVGVDV